MIRKSVLGFAVLFTIQLAFAQSLQKSYDLPPGGRIFIDNFAGDVKITGYSGKTIEVKSIRKGPESDAIRIDDMSYGSRLEIMVRYPRVPGGTTIVDLEVKVPSAVSFNFDRIASFVGNVSVTNVMGRLMASSVRGIVDVRDVRGLVSAQSISGNVTVEIGRVQEPGNMRFRSISGDVLVSAPANLDALIAMSSDSGMLRSDFPIDIQERRYGPGREAKGKLGSGKQSLWINSNSGRVSLIQRPERQAL
jgi:hypothetical protein